MTLQVINGGASAAGANGGAGGGVQQFEEHPLAEALLDVLTRSKGLRDVGQIAIEMSRLLKRRVTRGQVSSVIRHNRDHLSEYDSMVSFVQKGNGAHRLYWVQDGTKAVTLRHKEAYDAGMLSAWRDVSTRIKHAEEMSQVFSDIDNLSRGDRRKYNKLAGDTAAINTLVQNFLTAVS